MDSDATVVHIRLPEIALQVAAKTHPGRTRPHNEDAFMVDVGLRCVAVADGMGGHARGEVASQEVLVFLNAFLRGRPVIESVMVEALQRTNRHIYEINRRQGFSDGTGMGTTIAGLWFNGDSAICFHVGDSRVYRLRDGQLVQLTKDHTLYQAWVDAGGQGIAPPTYILTRSMGPFPDVEPEVNRIDVHRGDLFVVCTDGLYRYWTPERLQQYLARERNLSLMVDELVEKANEGDGSDNITVVLVRVKPENLKLC